MEQIFIVRKNFSTILDEKGLNGMLKQGRFRELRQFGVEAFGSKFPEQDAEIISMAYNFYKNLDITDIKLELNTIGSKES